MNTVSYPNFRSWQADNRSLSNIGIYTGTSFNLASSGGAEFVQGGNVSWTMFRTLGVAPALGRDFKEDEDRVGAPNVIILSDRLWHDRFDGRPRRRSGRRCIVERRAAHRHRRDAARLRVSDLGAARGRRCRWTR